MSESALTSLIHLLSLLAYTRKTNPLSIEKALVLNFLQAQFDNATVEKYIKIFEQYFIGYSNKFEKKEKILSEIETLATNTNKQLNNRQRLFLLINLFEFSKVLRTTFSTDNDETSYFETIKLISGCLNISQALYSTLLMFVLDKFHLINSTDSFLILTGDKLGFLKNLKHEHIEGLKGFMYVLRVKKDFLLVKYLGNDNYYIDNRLLKSNLVYFFGITSIIIINKQKAIYFNELQASFLNIADSDRAMLFADNISYSYKNSNNGIKPFSFIGKSGELVGIIGNSGTGKTTLINILTGNLPLSDGKVYINGQPLTPNLRSSGIIGYVPQDDIVIDDLTVYRNLYFNTRLCLNENNTTIKQKINEILEVLGIFEIRDLKIGSPVKKIISGGQRKRLNLANELIREPLIVFIDEPTSGLSSSDALHLMKNIKNLALNNKLFFVNIHQPSDSIYHLFDQVIILDKGGYPIYTGRPGSALEYFKSISRVITSKTELYQSEQEQILSIIEEPVISETGDETSQRLIEPGKWYEYFKNNFSLPDRPRVKPKKDLPGFSRLPNAFVQFYSYFLRDFFSKWANAQYKTISLLVSPLLATVLSFLCKQHTPCSEGICYHFSENSNIPAFYFMAIIVAIFVGLMTSAEDIVKDKKFLVRERFLNLNRISYYSSKIILLTLFSAIQTISFVVISILILKIQTSIFVYWITLFLISVLSNLTGLFISALLDSLVAIYILIPIILIPQILLTGVVVKFENLHPFVSSKEFVPLVSDLMPSRWAYETLVINQFSNNPYQKFFIGIEKRQSRLSFLSNTHIPKLIELVETMNKSQAEGNVEAQTHINSAFVQNELNRITSQVNQFFNITVAPYKGDINNRRQLINYLNELNFMCGGMLQQLMAQKDALISELSSSNNLQEIYQSCYNNAIADLALNKNLLVPYHIGKNRVSQLSDPVYSTPYNIWGRSILFSSQKLLINKQVDTIIFNLVVIFLMIITGVLIIFNDIPYKIKGHYKKQ
ncbi:MAG: ATP-binding cassette domain-containing protein [Bacteroidales bacterium]|nr:ATP-binding cassette domain-containing protein [Bacteroidales bacterium]